MNDMLRLIEPMIPSLRRYARALVGNQTVADDLVQDCLERAVSRWDQRRDGDARPWMFTILHNLAVSQFRQTAFRGTHVTIDDADQSLLRLEPAQEQKLLYQDVMSKLAELPNELRSVLLLVAVEDLSYAEAAKVLDIPVGTVMSRLSRARERLLRKMEETANVASNKVAHLRSVK
jgi:RNA polymerase sigma-70 factor (ECF subfamily)